jgi:hypothetical protein
MQGRITLTRRKRLTRRANHRHIFSIARTSEPHRKPVAAFCVGHQCISNSLSSGVLSRDPSACNDGESQRESATNRKEVNQWQK